MIKAVIFDMYETLITLWYSNPYMGHEMALEAGIPEAKFREIWDTTDDDRALGKRTFEDVLEEILRTNNCYSDELFNEIVKKRKASKIDSFNHIQEGIVPMLEGLKREGIKIGLITNCFTEESEVIIESVLFPYFDAVCMSCVEELKKPDRRIFDLCLKRLNVEAGECIYCGDGGSHELETAKALGMRAVQALWYLKENSGQPVSRLLEFEGIKKPEDIVMLVDREN